MAELFNTDRFGELYNASRRPTSDHLLLAAKYIAQICETANIPYAFMGGWTVRLRGGTRETQDVDITVSATMEQLKQTVLQMPRICFPQVHGQRAVNIFVLTGESYDNGYKDLSDLAVQVDVILSGNLNSPERIRNDTTETIMLTGGFSARVVNIYYLLRGKFHAFATRGQFSSNDYHDLVFLINKYQDEVVQCNQYIEKAHRLAFLEKFVEKHNQETRFVVWMRQVLGLEEEALQPEASSSNWVWDQGYGRYRRLVDGEWQWAPTQ